jgi:hypothetical protein
VGAGTVSSGEVTIVLKKWEANANESNLGSLDSWAGVGVYHVGYIVGSNPFGQPTKIKYSVTFSGETTVIALSDLEDL